MPETSLHGRRILIVEDEYMLADELQTGLEDAGATVIGPAADLADATTLIHREPNIDGALLDANLGGELVYSVADLLVDRGVPIVFTTGYDASAFPTRFSAFERCEKPVSLKRVTEAIGKAIQEK